MVLMLLPKYTSKSQTFGHIPNFCKTTSRKFIPVFITQPNASIRPSCDQVNAHAQLHLPSSIDCFPHFGSFAYPFPALLNSRSIKYPVLPCHSFNGSFSPRLITSSPLFTTRNFVSCLMQHQHHFGGDAVYAIDDLIILVRNSDIKNRAAIVETLQFITVAGKQSSHSLHRYTSRVSSTVKMYAILSLFSSLSATDLTPGSAFLRARHIPPILSTLMNPTKARQNPPCVLLLFHSIDVVIWLKTRSSGK